MTMELKNRNVVIDINKDVKANINLKRKRACQYAAYLTAVATSFKESCPSLGQSKNCINTDVVGFCSRESKRRSDKCGLHNHANFHESCSDKAIVHNYGNFRKSSLPSRVMYFWKGEWNEFPLNTLDPIKKAFQAKISVAEVSIGSSLYLVDFLRMVQINVKNGIQHSIAWIDENDECFCPTFVLEGNCCFKCGDDTKDKCTFLGSEKVQQIDVKVEIGISGRESCKSVNSSEISVIHVKSQKHQAQVLCTGSSDSEQGSSDTQKQSRVFPSCQLKEACLDYETEDVTAVGPLSKVSQYNRGTDSSRSPGFGMLADRLIKLEEGDHEFLNVQNRFLAGLCTLVPFSRIIGIHRISPSSSSGKARLQAFQNHVDITREFRGNANVKYAWHGTSWKCVSGFVLHGFGPSQIRTPKSGAAYGIGVYLAPENCSHVSATYSDVDENGEQHIVLCRVIMGNMEQVKPGSQQFHPSNESFDSGVDNIKNPKCYIVWSTHMNTHIYPEYVVSFKVSAEACEYWAGLRANYGMHGAGHPLLGHQLRRGFTCEMARIQQHPISAKEVQKKIQGPTEVPVKPTSTWILFPVLFSVIGKHLSSSSIDCLQRHYADFKKRRISRGDLIKRMRMIAGDKLVINAIKSIRSQKIGTEGFDGLEEVPCVGLHQEKVHSKNDFTLFRNKTSVTGPSVLQCQNLIKPKPTIDAQRFSCKDEFASHNGQAHY